MTALLDANVLSLVLRRTSPNPTLRNHLESLLLTKSAFIIGAIRQEVLSGFQTPEHYERLHQQLRSIPLITTLTEDHDLAAIYFNRCRRAGIQAHHHDFLLAAISSRLSLPIWTLDLDFRNFSPHIPINLYSPPPTEV